MTIVTFTHPISKTRHYEGDLLCTCEVQDDQVNILQVIKVDRSGTINITNCLPAHGYTREDIVLMALNDEPEWAVHNDHREKVSKQWNEVTQSYETY